MNWQGETVLITGASQGIGRALALHFAPRCAMTYLVARNEERLAETVALVEKAGGACSPIVADLRDPQSLQRVAEAVDKAGVSVLINNAADVTSKPFQQTSLEEIDSLLRTNVIGPLQLTRLLVPKMIEQGHGAIVNVSSLAGYKANPTQTVYSISKSSVNAMSEALRKELAPSGIRVVTLALPSVALEGEPTTGHVPVAEVCASIERAIERGEREVFFSLASRWLMRLYRAFPALSDVKA